MTTSNGKSAIESTEQSLPDYRQEAVPSDAEILADSMQFGSDMVTKYSKVCGELAQANATIAALQADVKEFDGVMDDQTWCINDQHNQIAALQAKENELLAVIEQMRELAIRPHYSCEEDPWYSCPKCKEGCANDLIPHECNCGAEKHNARVLAVTPSLAALKEHDAQVAGIFIDMSKIETGRPYHIWEKDGRTLAQTEGCEVIDVTPPEHTTKGTFCWCDPKVEERPDESLLVIHNKD